MTSGVPTPPEAPGASGAPAKSTETLSQFVARVLDQLSVSSWLPSAALVLLALLIFQLGAVLDGNQSANVLSALGQTFGALGRIGFGALFLLIVAVVVFTIVTQAFSFEAIRFLEGYWGTNCLVEGIARRRCSNFSKARARLEERHRQLTSAAWAAASDEMGRLNQKLLASGKPAQLTAEMISHLGSRALGRKSTVSLTRAERALIAEIDWHEYAPPDLLRRRLNVVTRLRDYPEEGVVLPTRLGNVLRRHEGETGRESVESLVQEVYDVLPRSLQVEHDEQRNRLDLYCSMVFVCAFSALIGAARFAPVDLRFSAAAPIVGLALMWLMNRAAISSARSYGGLLVLIAGYAPAVSEHDEQVPTRWARWRDAISPWRG